MGKSQRTKGRIGQSTFERMMLDRDWKTDPITAGVKREDLIATSPEGVAYACEVKNHTTINLARFRAQAIEQAEKRGLPWMLGVKLAGSSSWIVWRKGEKPVIWHQKDDS
jgi:hypothetical protein